MLVLSRKADQRIVIDSDIEIVVLEILGNRVKLGIIAPPSVPIHRDEIHRRIFTRDAVTENLLHASSTWDATLYAISIQQIDFAWCGLSWVIMCAQQLLTGRHPNLDTSKFFVEDLVARRFAAHCPYAYYCKDVTYHYAVGVLTLRGRVPTTALRQAIESLLTGVLGVEYIENEIDVINANGLSVVRPK